MEARLDLHIHSFLSHDGRMTQSEIVEAARAKGLQGVAICDHDRLFVPEQEDDGFLVIGGEEFSTEYGHLLGLFLKEPVEASDFQTCVMEIHRQGGLAVLAHPFERSADAGRLEPILPFLDGIEVWNGRANRKRKSANDEALQLAKSRSLPCFAGSDAHVLREIGNGFVTVTVEELTENAVKAALLLKNNPVSGVDGKHLDVARSQYTKLKKSGKGLKSCAKWLFFAGKCLLEDLTTNH